MRIFILAFALATVSAAAELPTPSDQFVNSVGVNVHLYYTNSIYYSNFPLILQSLHSLNVRHVRDGVQDFGAGNYYYYSNHQALAKAGITANFIVSTNTAPATIAAWPSRVQDVEAYESSNEIDASGDANWVNDIKSLMTWLLPAAQIAGVPLIGPSFVTANSYPKVGDIHQLMTLNSLHNYFGGFYPETPGWGGADAQGHGYGSIAWNLDQAAVDGPGVPAWTTETGYDVNTSDGGSVPASVYATYIGRMLFAQWNAGIKRTFIYQLADEPSTGQSFGLMDNTGNRRPAFNALANLLALLEDPGASFAPSSVNYTLGGSTANVQHTLMQKRDGSSYLALWIARPVYDPNAKTTLTVPSQTVTVTLPANIGSASLYTYDANWNLNPSGLSISSGQVTFPVTQNVGILKLLPAAQPAVQPAIWLPPVGVWFHLLSKNSNRCVDVYGGPAATYSGAALDQWDCWGGSNQLLQLNAVNGGYEMTFQNSSLQMDVWGGPSATQDGTQVVQYPYWGGTNEIWNLNQTTDGYVTVTALSSGKCLDVQNQATNNGAAIVQWTCLGRDSQKWSVVTQ